MALWFSLGDVVVRCVSVCDRKYLDYRCKLKGVVCRLATSLTLPRCINFYLLLKSIYYLKRRNVFRLLPLFRRPFGRFGRARPRTLSNGPAQ
jgi:hypothetical protein